MMRASEGGTNMRGGGLRSRDIPDFRRRKTLAEIEAEISKWEGMKRINADDPKTLAVCDRALAMYRKQRDQPRLPEGA